MSKNALVGKVTLLHAIRVAREGGVPSWRECSGWPLCRLDVVELKGKCGRKEVNDNVL